MNLPLRESYDPNPAATAPRDIPLWRALPRALYCLVRSRGDSIRVMQELFRCYGARTLRFALGSFELELTIDPERAKEILVEESNEYPKARNAPCDLLTELAMERYATQVSRAFAERAEQWPGGVFDLDWTREASAIANQAKLDFSCASPGEAWRVAADTSPVERGMSHLPAWCGQLLADLPEVQCQLRDELLALGRSPSLLALESAPYLEAVILEALRLYPPMPFLLRRREFGKRSYLFIPIQAMHRSQEFWESPDEFTPERWLTRGGSVIPTPPHFLPYGPRVSVGKRFALIELRVILAEFIRRYRIVPAISGYPGASGIILARPKSPVMLFCLPAFGLGTGVASLVPDEKTSDAGRRHNRSGGE